MHARVPPQRAERRQVALDETVVPAADRKDGHVNLVEAHTRACTAPEAIVAGMIERLLKNFVPLTRSCKIRIAQRQRAHEAREIRRDKTGRLQVLRHPKETVAKLERSAG